MRAHTQARRLNTTPYTFPPNSLPDSQANPSGLRDRTSERPGGLPRMAQVASGRGGPEPHPADSEPNGIRPSLHLPTGSLLGPQSADLLAVTPHSRSGRKKPGGWPGSYSLCPGSGETWARHRRGRSRGWRYGQAPTAVHCEGGQREQGDIVLAPGPWPYLIAFQPTHELFFNSILSSLKRLVTQKFSKFPIISRREET